ncbi:LPXTG cell wall anchor domain-containing protein [Streptomyces djakartensis]|uniref:Gram-positive cocci surface proteins LPxTG domain-containing protein n=1 Tax=Streptomyces djakartensis TaxID=68193 RepID=A0ABQ3ABE0_9ACTN|nr:LPXTG cell wall anchor domain-containing protein [Streptomyces djakartensis]GGY45495.1 hypothetical protein GCM10010384_60210 [Streptomyces djakartensis]
MALAVPPAAMEYLAKPKGPSWSPFLAIGMVVLFAIIIGLLLVRRRRR